MTPPIKSNTALLSAIILLSLILPSCGSSGHKTVVETKFFMDTAVRVEVALDKEVNEAAARSAISKAFDEIGRVEGVFSVYKPESEVSRINGLGKDERLQIPEEVFVLIKESIGYSKKTGGAFDITVKPLVDLWGKAKKAGRLPAEGDIRLALDRVGYEKIVLDEASKTISFRTEGMALDFGGVAKGYATDRAVEVLKKNGIENAVVNPGGSVYCMGRKSRTELWEVGIRHPRHMSRIFLEISLENMAIDTSGDYERYFILDGRRYSHIIDPRTGYPIGDDVISSSVIAPDALCADVLATSLAILGDNGIKTAESIKGVDAVIVFKRNGGFIVKMTEGMKKRYEIHEEGL